MPFAVNSSFVESHILPTILGPGGRCDGVLDPEVIQTYVDEAAAEVQQRLSTRFVVTRFQGWMGPGIRPQGTVAVPADGVNPAVEALEYEAPHLWPNISPSAGYLSWRMLVRPIVEMQKGILRLPGSHTPGVEIQPDWLRVNPHSSEITLMPSYGSAAMVTPSLPFGLFNWMHQRVPEAVAWHYRAGMTDEDWRRFPQINRLVGLRAAIMVLPVLSMRINPSGLTSQSADGLSQSRSSGYVFKDLEERLKNEADAIQSQVLDAWDGTAALNIL